MVDEKCDCGQEANEASHGKVDHGGVVEGAGSRRWCLRVSGECSESAEMPGVG